ncbi:transcriptional regulator PpsR [Litoreibacter roseus]|uniref:Transcriptional regulator PpsR n=1 Tax=Litoreibacter roseus TaxID=2601869 RepID=A0A6N6JH67_9RHOB|nr:transcriptional regulator PpsR [Litoreibacter roseus]GFE64628.1 transcriptional regulator PpsR [Litoreibacter roseus]
MNIREIGFWIDNADPQVAPDYINQVIATAADIAIVVTNTGEIEMVTINPLTKTMGQLDHWKGRNICEFLAEDSVNRVMSIIEDYRRGKAQIIPAVEVNHFDNANWQFPISYSFHLTGQDGRILMLGRDMRAIAELQQRLVKAQLALERDYEAHRDFETRYRVLMETSQDALVLMSAASGRITDCNQAAARVLGGSAEALVGCNLESEVEANGSDDFIDSLAGASAENIKSGVSVVARRSGRKISIHPTLFRAAGERTFLCRLETETATDGADIEISGGLETLFQKGVDAIVFTDDRGVIRFVNEAFLGLTDIALMSSVKGRPIADFLVRGKIDSNVLLENATRAGRMQLYATQLVGSHGSSRQVEISATRLDDGPQSNFAFILRDASRGDLLRSQDEQDSTHRMNDIVDLVGSSPLKDIVAATTDVIEKICIETAVELTGNNRVAVAEMLGLSRQSLYVKLRKYNLLDKSPKD